jgi:preprotein translocase subunit SecG
MASAFGGGGSQAAFGARAGATLLSKLTTAFAAVFMLCALGLAILGQRGTGSILSGSAPPAPAAVPLAPTPAGQMPAAAPTTPGAAPATQPAQGAAPAQGTTTPAAPAPAPDQK